MTMRAVWRDVDTVNAFVGFVFEGGR